MLKLEWKYKIRNVTVLVNVAEGRRIENILKRRQESYEAGKVKTAIEFTDYCMTGIWQVRL